MNYYQDIENARIQWNTYTSKKDSDETFDFPKTFGNDAPSALINRTKAGAKDILPVTKADKTTFTVNRHKSIHGKEQGFNLIAIGGLTDKEVHYSNVMYDERKVAMIQWGHGKSYTDSEQVFEFPTSFEYGCKVVITNRMHANSESILPVTAIDNEIFKINRENGISGSQNFYWIAVGDCGSDELGNFSFSIGDFVMKGGIAMSTIDSVEEFQFQDLGVPNYEEDCYTVVTNRMKANTKSILPVTAMTKSSFFIDREGGIDHKQEFFWLAIGK